jgi:hypothetical protein
MKIHFDAPDPIAIPRLVWARQFEAAYDSSMCLFEILAILNPIGARKFLADFCGLSHVGDPPINRSALTCECFIPAIAKLENPALLGWYGRDDWREIAKTPATDGILFPAIPFYAQILRRTLAFYGGHMASSLAHTSSTRFCPECIKVGYTSVFHQMPALILCPIHRCELSDRCMSCHCLSKPFMFDRYSFATPFGCKCGWVAVDSDAATFARTPTFRAAEAVAMRPIAQWVRRVSELRLDFSHIARDRLDRGMDSASSTASLFPYIASLIPAPCGGLFMGEGKIIHHVLGKRQSPPDTGPKKPIDNLELFAIYKSIDRYIVKHLVGKPRRKIMGDDLGRFAINPIALAVVPDGDACLLSQAYALWRLRTFNAPLLYHRGNSLRWRGLPRLPDYSSFIGGILSHVEHDFAYKTLGKFFDAVDAMIFWRQHYGSLDDELQARRWRETTSNYLPKMIERMRFGDPSPKSKSAIVTPLVYDGRAMSFVFMTDPKVVIHARECKTKPMPTKKNNLRNKVDIGQCSFPRYTHAQLNKTSI